MYAAICEFGAIFALAASFGSQRRKEDDIATPAVPTVEKLPALPAPVSSTPNSMASASRSSDYEIEELLSCFHGCGPISNKKLAKRMRVDKSEASRRWKRPPRSDYWVGQTRQACGLVANAGREEVAGAGQQVTELDDCASSAVWQLESDAYLADTASRTGNSGSDGNTSRFRTKAISNSTVTGAALGSETVPPAR